LSYYERFKYININRGWLWLVVQSSTSLTFYIPWFTFTSLWNPMYFVLNSPVSLWKSEGIFFRIRRFWIVDSLIDPPLKPITIYLIIIKIQSFFLFFFVAGFILFHWTLNYIQLFRRKWLWDTTFSDRNCFKVNTSRC